jgi:hypothetical protein
VSNEWASLKGISEVATAYASGWEIEIRAHESHEWQEWEDGLWFQGQLYRGRPKQPTTVTYECFAIDGRLVWIEPSRSILAEWIRIPEQDITVSVK